MADIGRIALATALMAGVLLLAGGWLHGLAELPWPQRVLRLAGVCGAGIVVYFGALLLQQPRFLQHARGRSRTLKPVLGYNRPLWPRYPGATAWN